MSFNSCRFFTGLALLQQEQTTSEETEREAALFLHQGLEHFVSRHCSCRSVGFPAVVVESIRKNLIWIREINDVNWSQAKVWAEEEEDERME